MRTAKSNPKPTKISNVHSNCTLAVPSYSAPEWTLLFFELIFLHSEPDKQRIVLFIVLQLLLAAETFIQLDSSRRLQAPVRVSARPFWSSSVKWKVPFKLHWNVSHWQDNAYLLFRFPCGAKREGILESASTNLRADHNLIWTIQERM